MGHKLYNILFTTLATILVLSSCSEYARVQKSTDIVEKYSYAKMYFNKKKYDKAAGLLEDVVPFLKGSDDAAPSLYLLADCYYHMKEYDLAQQKFKEYYTSYPRSPKAELALYYSGYGLTQDIPDARLDQTKTYAAISELQRFIDKYPQSPKAKEATQLLFKLQEQLAYKQLLSVRLYYNLGNYIFNNYKSAIITAKEALKEYPYSKYKEDFEYYIVASLYEIAYNSIESKKQNRIRDLRDEYYNYINEFPNGKHAKKLEKDFLWAEKNIKGEE